MPEWDALIDEVRHGPPNTNRKIPKDSVGHPRAVGFRRSLGQDFRARAHWRRALPDGAGAHVLEFSDHYLVHWDRFDPQAHLLKHLWIDARKFTASATTAAFGVALVTVLLS